MSKKNERVQKIIDLLKQRDGISVKEFAEMLNVSEMTIRRDMEMLAQKGHVLFVKGIAILNRQKYDDSNLYNYNFSEEYSKNRESKDRIAKYAASLIEPNDSIIIDNGSTMSSLPQYLSGKGHLTVATCDLCVLNRLSAYPEFEIIFGGGYFHWDTYTFESPETIRFLEGVRANKVFVSAAGIHDAMGITCSNQYEIRIKRTIMSAGARKILLVDSEKFGVVRPQHFAEISNFDEIVTDQGLSETWKDYFSRRNVRLTIV